MLGTLFNEKIAHPLQSYEWGEYCRQLGFHVIRDTLERQKEPPYGVQVLVQPTKLQNCSLGYLPQAPLPDSEQINFLREMGRRYQCLSVKIEPDQWWRYPLNSVSSTQKASVKRTLLSLPLLPSHSIYPRFTMKIPLNGSEGELLERMHHKTRYNIRLAIKKKVRVDVDNSEACFYEFLNIFFTETAIRPNFHYLHTREELIHFWNSVSGSQILTLLKATYEEKTLAIMMLFKVKNRLYFPHGASTRENKEVMGSHLLMWSAMQFAVKEGCSEFDLWGVPDPISSEKSNLIKGLPRFFEGFGALYYERLGAFDLIP